VRIDLTMEGGFAPLGGPARRFSLDASELEAAEAARLDTLIAAVWQKPLPEADLSGMPDVFVYHVSVTDESGCRSATFDDVTASPDLHALVARVLALAERSAPG
jgi:hypothetical protein